MENHVTNCGENLNLLWKKTIRLQEDRIWRLVERIWREGEIATGESAHGENCGKNQAVRLMASAKQAEAVFMVRVKHYAMNKKKEKPLAVCAVA